MAASKEQVNQLVEAFLEVQNERAEMQKYIVDDLEKLREEKKEAIRVNILNHPSMKNITAWEDDIPADATAKEVALAWAYYDFDPEAAKLNMMGYFDEALRDYIADLSAQDDHDSKTRYNSIMYYYGLLSKTIGEVVNKINDTMSVYQENARTYYPGRIGHSILFCAPGEDDPDWTVVSALYRINDDWTVSMPDTIDGYGHALKLSIETLAEDGETTLTQEFTNATISCDAGDKIEPIVVSAPHLKDAPQRVLMQGHLEYQGVMTPVNIGSQLLTAAEKKRRDDYNTAMAISRRHFPAPKINPDDLKPPQP